jgi:hypothetical protein
MTKLVITIFALALASICVATADESVAPVVPKPRKRLQREAENLDHATVEGSSTIGAIQTIESRYIRTIADCVQKRFKQNRKSNGDDLPFRTKITVRLKVNVQTRGIEVIDILGDINENLRASLKSSAEQCSGLVDVPAELVRKGDDYIGVEIHLTFLPN